MENILEIPAVKGENLGTPTYRGFARFCDLARISAGDVKDDFTNPKGTTRPIDSAHAYKAYWYAKEGRGALGPHRFWPEIVLNVRDTSVISVEEVEPERNLVTLQIRLDKIDKRMARPQISRIDGNHRLHFANGDDTREMEPAEVAVPFSLLIGLSPDEEAALFKDINDNQKGMDTSHLDYLVVRLTPEEKLAQQRPELWIAERLSTDPKSPFCGLIHKGGSREGARSQGLKRPINMRSLSSGVNFTLRESVKLRDIPDIEGKYVLIRNLWKAVQTVYAEEWANPKDHLLLKGMGMWAISMLGAEVIDRCINRRNADVNSMQAYISQTRRVFDWSLDGDVAGYGGQKGAREVAQQLKKRLSDEGFDVQSLIVELKKQL